MNLTFLRGACTVIETKGLRILTDPWLSDGIYSGSWAHFPAFTDEDWGNFGLDTIDYIYVSHIHPDHFDPVTMRRLRKLYPQNDCPPVLIHKYPTSFLKTKIQETGFDVYECDHGRPTKLGGSVYLSIFSADDCDPRVCGSFFGCAMPSVRNTQIDSMAVLTDGTHTIVNINDCPWQLSKKLVRKIASEYPVIDLAMIAYAGAGPFPQCFNMPVEQKRIEAARKRTEFCDNVIHFAKALRADRVFPFAGDYQLCGSLSPLNELRGVPDVAYIYQRLKQADIKTLQLNPGQTASIDRRGYRIVDTVLERIRYVDDVLSKRKLDYEDEPIEDIDEPLLKQAFARFDAKRKEHGLNAKATTYIDMGNKQFVIPPSGEPFMAETSEPKEPFVRLSTDPRLLKQLLRGPKYAHWNNAQIGSHIMFDRKPMRLYESGLYHLLSFFHA